MKHELFDPNFDPKQNFYSKNKAAKRIVTERLATLQTDPSRDPLQKKIP